MRGRRPGGVETLKWVRHWAPTGVRLGPELLHEHGGIYRGLVDQCVGPIDVVRATSLAMSSTLSFRNACHRAERALVVTRNVRSAGEGAARLE